MKKLHLLCSEVLDITLKEVNTYCIYHIKQSILTNTLVSIYQQTYPAYNNLDLVSCILLSIFFKDKKQLDGVGRQCSPRPSRSQLITAESIRLKPYKEVCFVPNKLENWISHCQCLYLLLLTFTTLLSRVSLENVCLFVFHVSC